MSAENAADSADALVDAMAELLAASKPAAIGDEETRELVQRALAAAAGDEDREADEVDEDALVDLAAARIAGSDPAEIDLEEARTLAASALATADDAAGGAEVVALEGYRHLPLLAAAAVMLMVVSAAILSRPDEAPPRVHRFESGHRIVAAPGARLDWDESAYGLEVQLEGGEAMFDIDPDAEQSVRVRSGSIAVRVTGTVFTVERRERLTRVAVFEGSVSVEGGGPVSLLTAGDRWEGEPGRRVLTVGVPFEPSLAEEAEWAAQRRARQQSVDDFVPNLPAVPDLAADGRLPPPSDQREPPVEGDQGRVDEPAAAGGVERAHPAPPPRMEDARAALTERRYGDARLLADRALAAGTTADWLLVRGDALRGDGRLDEAAAEYTRAALVGDPRDRAVAGLSAARVLGRDLGRVGPAREILTTSGALAPGSPVRPQAEALAQELGLAPP